MERPLTSAAIEEIARQVLDAHGGETVVRHSIELHLREIAPQIHPLNAAAVVAACYRLQGDARRGEPAPATGSASPPARSIYEGMAPPEREVLRPLVRREPRRWPDPEPAAPVDGSVLFEHQTDAFHVVIRHLHGHRCTLTVRGALPASLGRAFGELITQRRP